MADTTGTADIPILFDVPTKSPRECSSLNVMKTRAALSFKGVSYRTEWLEYPEVGKTLESFGIPKNDPKEYAEWTLPVVKVPSGQYLMESTKIAVAMDAVHPEPPMYVSSDETARTQELADKLMYALAPAYIYRIADDLLTEGSGKWYHEQRGKLFGKKDLYEVAQMEPWAGDKPWKNAKPVLDDIVALLNKDTSGPFVVGSTPSYADINIASLWFWAKLLSRDGDLYKRVVGFNAAFAEHEKACAKWFERKD